MRVRIAMVVAVLLAVALASTPPASAKEPDLIVVQHILIGFKDKVPNKELKRTKKQASTLALELLDRAVAGEDFDALVKEYTNDRYPGLYMITNKGVATRSDALPRNKLAIKFGDIAFRLEIGEVGLAKYNAISSPFGYHIIKRLE